MVNLNPVLTPGLPGVQAVKGSILFLPMPIEGTINHVIDTLPSDQNIEIVVKGTTRQRFSKQIGYNLEKVK